MTAEEIARKGLILHTVVGSTVHGLNVPGTDDHDEMGICVEPPAYVMGLKHFEQWVFRTKPEGVRSGPGDTDLTVYSLRKWMRLAAKGNPTVLLPLYAPEASLLSASATGRRLRTLAPALASVRAGEAFLGYLVAQKQRLLGERGQMRVKRPELAERFRYDVKYAMHILRLGVQGVELLQTGQITLPMPYEERELIYSVRCGERSLQWVTTWAGELECELKDLINGGSPLPKDADMDALNNFLVDEYAFNWALRKELDTTTRLLDCGGLR